MNTDIKSVISIVSLPLFTLLICSLNVYPSDSQAHGPLQHLDTRYPYLISCFHGNYTAFKFNKSRNIYPHISSPNNTSAVSD